MSVQVPELMTVDEVAAWLRIPGTRVRRLIRAREFATYRIGARGIRIIVPSVERYLDRCTAGIRTAA